MLHNIFLHKKKIKKKKKSQGKVAEFSFRKTPVQLRRGDVVIATITSCTNTSNPSVMLGAALVAMKACELELEVKPWIKESFNYLASPPLVVAYALERWVLILKQSQLVWGRDGKQIFFRDIWPSNDEVAQVVHSSVLPDLFKATYQAITKGNPMWNQLFFSFRQSVCLGFQINIHT